MPRAAAAKKTGQSRQKAQQLPKTDVEKDNEDISVSDDAPTMILDDAKKALTPEEDLKWVVIDSLSDGEQTYEAANITSRQQIRHMLIRTRGADGKLLPFPPVFVPDVMVHKVTREFIR